MELAVVAASSVFGRDFGKFGVVEVVGTEFVDIVLAFVMAAVGMKALAGIVELVEFLGIVGFVEDLAGIAVAVVV